MPRETLGSHWGQTVNVSAHKSAGSDRESMAPFSGLYRTRSVLAPMVRSGQLPLRLLALRQGAGLVYSEELVDRKVQQAKRVVNATLQTIDYVAQGRCIFRTCSEEKGKVILQLGSADPELAVGAARVVADDVAGIDLNMGCPAPFSTHSGMGSGLLKTLDLACDILKTLVVDMHPRGVAVTAKVRILESMEDTVDMLRRLEATGIDAIAVHFRMTDERPRVPARLAWLPELVKAVAIPVLANGDMWTRADIDRVLRDGAASAMVARGALKNTSVHGSVDVPFREMLRQFTWLAIQYDMPLGYYKYTVDRMIGENLDQFTQSERCIFQRADHFQVAAHQVGITEEQYRSICDNLSYPWYIDDAHIKAYGTKKLKKAKAKEIEDEAAIGRPLPEGKTPALHPPPPPAAAAEDEAAPSSGKRAAENADDAPATKQARVDAPQTPAEVPGL